MANRLPYLLLHQISDGTPILVNLAAVRYIEAVGRLEEGNTTLIFGEHCYWCKESFNVVLARMQSLEGLEGL